MPLVRYEEWLQANEEYLLDIYDMIQGCNLRTGRQVFDRDRCKFVDFCNLAWNWSTLYNRTEAWMYEREEEEEEWMSEV